MNFSNQVHDFDPGIAPNGVFWTVAVPRSSVTVHPGSGEASLVVSNFAVRDYFNIPNALMRGAFNSATVSFDVRWASGRKKVKVRDEANGFAGQFVENSAQLSWSATSAGSTYRSVTGDICPFALVGEERNGVFFPQSDD